MRPAASRPGAGGPPGSLIARGFRGSWADVALRPEVEDLAVTAWLAEDNAAALQAVRHNLGEDLAGTARETLLLSAQRADEQLTADLRADGFAVVTADGVLPATAVRPADPGRLWLLTSGSTGRPKRVAHTLDSLATVAGEQPARRWLCPYSPGAYAWWQVVTLALRHSGQDIVFVESDALDGWPELALAEGVTAASGTPTFWRQALWRTGDTVAKLSLEQITLGGEPVDQAILDRLIALFPAARVSWIYASSEAGATIAVHDGRAGFPVAWLERSAPGRPRLSLDGAELLIDSPYRAEGQPAVLRTGDRVEVVDGRVLITGRLGSDEINVGGSKASAGQVRAVLLAHPGVVWAHVRGRKAPLVGNVVVADVVLEDSRSGETDGAPPDTERLTRWCAERLPDYAVPRRIRVLDAIPIKETLKSDV